MTLDSVYPIFFCKHFNVGLSVVYRYQIMLTTFLFKHEPLQMVYTGIKTFENAFCLNFKMYLFTFQTVFCRCLAHDKAQIYRIFSYGAHTILSDQVLAE